MPPRGRDSDLRLLLGDREREGDLRPPRFGDRDSFLLGDGELLRRFGEADIDLPRCFGDLDFFNGFETFFLGVREREEERDREVALLRDFGDRESDFFLYLGDWERDRERDSWRFFRGVVESSPFEVDLEWILEHSSSPDAV